MAKLFKNKEIVGGIAFLLLSIWLIYQISHFPTTAERYRSLGPEVFPYFLSICLTFLSIAMIYQGIRRERGAILSFSFKEKSAEQMLLLIILVCSFAYFIEDIGFILGGLGFMALAQLIMGAKKWWFIIALSLAVVGIIYVLFVILLRVPLPEGIVLI